MSLYHGSLQWVATSATVLTSTTPAKAAGTTSGMCCHGFTHTADNRLTFVGHTGRTCMVTATFSCTKETATGELTKYYIYKNGVNVGPVITRTIASSTDHGAAAITVLVDMKKDDYVELWISSTGDDITIEGGTLIATVVG